MRNGVLFQGAGQRWHPKAVSRTRNPVYKNGPSSLLREAACSGVRRAVPPPPGLRTNPPHSPLHPQLPSCCGPLPDRKRSAERCPSSAIRTPSSKTERKNVVNQLAWSLSTNEPEPIRAGMGDSLPTAPASAKELASARSLAAPSTLQWNPWSPKRKLLRQTPRQLATGKYWDGRPERGLETANTECHHPCSWQWRPQAAFTTTDGHDGQARRTRPCVVWNTLEQTVSQPPPLRYHVFFQSDTHGHSALNGAVLSRGLLRA